mmetsp:Transcript_1995/g.3531  ORF Transcript_1995/g.3531 Transcript_1995/m.3531 type:complete len:91 (+) Transcript_1995:392-664(+)
MGNDHDSQSLGISDCNFLKDKGQKGQGGHRQAESQINSLGMLGQENREQSSRTMINIESTDALIQQLQNQGMDGLTSVLNQQHNLKSNQN